MRRPPVRGSTLLALLSVIAMSCSTSSSVSTERSDEAPEIATPITGPPITAPAAQDDPETDPDTNPPVPAPSTSIADNDEPGDDDARDEEGGTLDWSRCPESTSDLLIVLECATLRVPLDHSDPGGVMIDIAVARSPAGGDPIGSLVFNPGGPGSSGIEALRFLPISMSAEITRRFDLVSFDPRGVGMSTAVDCPSDLDDSVRLLTDGDDAGWADLVASNAEDRATCSAQTEDIAAYLGTNNAARDLDVLRAALGDDGLTYVGYSYGTRLGATYAELFPGNVRALVLDAGVKPTDDDEVLTREQGTGFDRALENFAAACDADQDCLLRDVGPTLDVVDQLVAEITELGSFPTDHADRRLTPGEFSVGVAAALYSRNTWPFLAQALFLAEAEQDGSLLQALGDLLLGRRVDGTYDNSQVAGRFISCADSPDRLSVDEQRTAAEESARASVYFVDLLRAGTGCLGFAEAVDPLIIGPASGAPPIVVIGNTGDPATPYEWSVELADGLESAVLYTVEAEGHTAYGVIECVTAEIDAYLIDLVVPGEGATCSDNVDADFFVPAGESELDQLLAFFDCLRDNGADIPEYSLADVLADPTLETIFGSVDFTDPDLNNALVPCIGLIADL